LRVAATEFIQFFPFLVLAFRPGNPRGGPGAAPVPVAKTSRPLGAER
jgi:hypothetical protein